MCGITGLFPLGRNELDLDIELRKMVSFIKHRGPDNTGYWSDEEIPLKIAHQRLSIIDLKITGNQPMISHSGRYVIALNGEIYNHKQIRVELEKSNQVKNWKGHSDTEVFLELIDSSGVQNALKKCQGMFAFALWDRKEKTLTLARDRMGEKPLYYGFSGFGSNKIFLFGSELSSLTNFKFFSNRINRHALSQLLNQGAISSPYSIYQDINQLRPGHIFTLNTRNIEDSLLSTEWWTFSEEIEDSLNNQFTNEEDAQINLEETLINSIQQQSVADVEIGSFLSGGIDSSLITALLQNQTKNKVRTFTIGFEESRFDESTYAKAVANYLGTNHTETILTASDAQKIIPNLSKIYSEPFADSSQIATYLVCQQAHNNNLKVALSGDGGDELFGGYNRYFLGPRVWDKLSIIPFPIRKSIGKIILKSPREGIDILGDYIKISRLGHKSHKLAERLSYINSNDELYMSLIGEWRDAYHLLKTNNEIESKKDIPYPLGIDIPLMVEEDQILKMMAYDTLNYLPNDILTKVDRAAMSNNLETRAPFLDHNVLKCAWRIPISFKTGQNKNVGKLVLKKILAKYIPTELIERPKMGFGVPVGEWIRGPLKQWSEELLSYNLIESQGFLKADIITKLYSEHQSGKYDHTAKLWHILMWQSWLDHNKEKVKYD